MKTDKELLELAAKAAGLVITEWVGSIPRIATANARYWEPLTDDGDALRLAVKLDMNIDVKGAWIRVDCGDDFVNENAKDDPYAATRRAIVRAAAAIGEKLCEI